MSEQPQPPRPLTGDGPLSPEAIATAADVVLGGDAPPSDDTPTIISKLTPKVAPREDLFNGILRGRTLAHFELIEPIGVGGMAAVLRARDTQLERFVALKILPPEMAADPENVARFHQEARAAARLDHETIARVFYCGADQDLHFIAFEFVEGENLRALFDRRGPLPAAEALHYMLQIATGLAHAAERGVVHRDIKPSNIIISPNGRAKLVDMGLARSLGPRADDGLTQSGVTLGTFDYISPEQALEPRDADGRSDIYSLGCTFYHVLTGRAPVPEGTAAKKLHHHQHVPPIDPRQLNPDVPDEVAAVLGRMMAKDPRQRYQRPEHLVQHLLQATQRLGHTTEGPEGVLFVDAPLPAPPRRRPLFVAAAAAALVVLLVFLIGPSQEFRIPTFIGGGAAAKKGSADPPGTPPGSAQAGGAADPKKQQPDPPAVDVEKPTAVRVQTADDLAALAKVMALAPARDYHVTLAADVQLGADGLAAEDGAGVVLRGKTITLRGERGKDGRRPTVWARYVPRSPVWGGLVLDAGRVELAGLRVVADANTNAPGQGQAAAGVLLRNLARGATVSDCEFLQGNWSEPSVFASVAVQPGPAPAPPHVLFERCAFFGGKSVKRSDGAGGAWLTRVEEAARGGQVAVAVLGAASVKADDCAFGPHAALFRLDGKARTVNGLLVDNCTALAGDDWSLAYLGEGAGGTVAARHSLFARAAAPDAGGMRMPMMPERKVACLVRQPAGAEPAQFQGEANRYLNIDAVQVRGADEAPADPVPFAEQLVAAGGTRDEVLPADTHLWKGEGYSPFAALEGALTPDDLLTAFGRDSFAAVPGLRYGPAQSPSLVGIKDSPWGGRVWDGTLPPLPGRERPAKVVDGTKKTGSEEGTYNTLGEALAAVKPGDVIAIRHTGPLKVAPWELIGKAGAGITIKADGDSRPVLTLDEDKTPQTQAALFRVHGGQLTLEGLEFRLRPKAAYDLQAVALLFGDGGVLFKRCVVTLDGRSPVPLSAVALADLTKKDAMPPAAAAAAPKVAFDTCFVRGGGDLVSSKSSRPFELEVTNSLAALTGSLLNVDAGAKELPAAPAGQRVSVKLTRVTAYLGGHLLRLRAPALASLVPVVCEPAKSCLFVSAAAAGTSLVHVEAGPKASDEKVMERLTWSGDDNTYANFSPMLEQQPRPDEMPAAVTPARWKESDGASKSEAVKFRGPLWADGDDKLSPAEVLPENFEVKSGPAKVGASLPDLKALLKPAADND